MLGVLNRNITKSECSWLSKDYEKGSFLAEYHGCTYGCVGEGGIAVVFGGESHFCEIPEDAIDWI